MEAERGEGDTVVLPVGGAAESGWPGREDTVVLPVGGAAESGWPGQEDTVVLPAGGAAAPGWPGQEDDPARQGRPDAGARVRANRLPAAIATLISIAVAGGTAIDLHYPGRTLVTVVFALVVPGWLLTSQLGFADRLAEFIAAVCVSVSTAILLAMTQVTLHAWHPEPVVSGWAALAALAGAVQALRPIRFRGRGTAR